MNQKRNSEKNKQTQNQKRKQTKKSQIFSKNKKNFKKQQHKLIKQINNYFKFTINLSLLKTKLK